MAEEEVPPQVAPNPTLTPTDEPVAPPRRRS